jgi:hypothetical protein
VNTNRVAAELETKPMQRKSIDEEQMLDIAEMIFIKMAD